MDAPKYTVRQGFALGGTFFWKVFRYKKLFLLAMIGALFEFMHQLVIWSFYKTCLWCLFLNKFIFGAFSYFFALVLFFYVRQVWHEKSSLGAVIPRSLRECFQNGFSIVRTPLFWIFVFIPLPGFTALFFIPFFIPVLAFPRESLGGSFIYLGVLIRKFWKLVFGFSVFVMMMSIIAAAIFLVPMNNCGGDVLLSACGMLMTSSMILFASFLSVLMAFAQVYIHEEASKQ